MSERRDWTSNWLFLTCKRRKSNFYLKITQVNDYCTWRFRKSYIKFSLHTSAFSGHSFAPCFYVELHLAVWISSLPRYGSVPTRIVSLNLFVRCWCHLNHTVCYTQKETRSHLFVKRQLTFSSTAEVSTFPDKPSWIILELLTKRFYLTMEIS